MHIKANGIDVHYTIDGVTYLIADATVDCGSDLYRYWVLGTAYTVLVAFGAGHGALAVA